MKKFLSIVLLFTMLLGMLSGCGRKENEQETEGSVASDATGDTTEVTSQPTQAPDKVFKLDWDEITLVAKGETFTLYSGNIDMSKIEWGTQDSSVAKFDAGVVTAVGNGNTEVFAEYGGNRLSCKVHCNLHQPPVPTETTEQEETGESTGTDTQEPTDAPKNPNAGPRDPVLQAPTTEAVPASFFDDAVFIGDSISLKLSYYAGETGLLGNAKFLVRGSYGVANGVFDKLLLSWQGQEMTVEDAVKATGAKKAFIMLGMNDIALYGVDKTLTHWEKLLERIRSKNPDVQIYIQSMTPVWTGGEKGDLNTALTEKYNAELKPFAESHGCKFIDVAPYMKDSTGGLATPYCSDKYVHVTDAGADTWIKVLKAYTGY